MKAAPALRLLVASLLLGWGLGAPVSSRAAPRGADTGGLFGRGQVPLANWARANKLDLRWRRDQTLQLTNRAARFVFGIDPRDRREAQFNGTVFYLSYPLAFRDGAAYISEFDLKYTLRPLLNPPRNAAGSKIRTIILDPGHGGQDTGTRAGSKLEKQYTLLLAQELAEQLKRAGFNVSLTRTSDTFVDLPDRPQIARRRAADLFVSLHWNGISSGKNDVSGIETYCLTPAGAPSTNAGGSTVGAGTQPGNASDDKNLWLAYTLQRSLQRNLRAEDRGVRRARFWVLRDAQMPAVLIEGGFMSNAAEARRIYDPAWRKQMARAIVEGIQSYKAQVETGR